MTIIKRLGAIWEKVGADGKYIYEEDRSELLFFTYVDDFHGVTTQEEALQRGG